MTRNTMILGAAASLAAAAIIIAVATNANRQAPVTAVASSEMLPYSTANASSSQEKASSAPVASLITGYTVREYQGHIAVFADGELFPVREVMEVDVEALPEQDRLLLQKGIHADTEESLNGIIEDYES